MGLKVGLRVLCKSQKEKIPNGLGKDMGTRAQDNKF